MNTGHLPVVVSPSCSPWSDVTLVLVFSFCIGDNARSCFGLSTPEDEIIIDVFEIYGLKANTVLHNLDQEMTSHWGEYASTIEVDRELAALQHEQMTKLIPMEIEGPRLHQPSSRHFPPSNDALPMERFQMDPMVMHTIQLLQHARRLKQLIANIQQHQSQSLEVIEYDTTYPDVPPIPQYTGPPPIKSKLMHPVPFMEKSMDSDLLRGKGEAPPVIDDISCRVLLRKSVAAILAHTGYDTCAESILETMTDDIIERVFQEFGLGSVTTIHDFYHQRVVNYHQNVEDQCVELATEYEKLKEPILQQKQQPDTLSVIRIKEEPSEIHFPELDEIDEVNNPEQLLNLNDLVGFEITVEHESASGLTTEVESKWSAVKAESGEAKISSYEQFEEGGSEVKEEPRSLSSSEADDSINDPPSINVSDILSPNSTPRRSHEAKI
ncbi:ST65G-like protein [Mya arenaria]|uniref:ST65G-like protein n=1 Tax=Mya arenaria TaxID=6604 RepID=A0ABY7DQV0_MYAAR|nr:ST65G-like protein [Mya arenaria]